MSRRRLYLFFYVLDGDVECAGPFTRPEMRTLAARAMFRTYGGDVRFTRVDFAFYHMQKCEPIPTTETERWL